MDYEDIITVGYDVPTKIGWGTLREAARYSGQHLVEMGRRGVIAALCALKDCRSAGNFSPRALDHL